MPVSVFQIVGVTLAGVMVLSCVRTMIRRQRRWIMGGVGALLWAVAGITVSWPGLSNRLSMVFGIGRGVDAVFYLAFLIVLVVLYYLSVSLCDLRRDVTRVARSLALQDVKCPAGEHGDAQYAARDDSTRGDERDLEAFGDPPDPLKPEARRPVPNEADRSGGSSAGTGAGNETS